MEKKDSADICEKNNINSINEIKCELVEFKPNATFDQVKNENNSLVEETISEKITLCVGNDVFPGLETEIKIELEEQHIKTENKNCYAEDAEVGSSETLSNFPCSPTEVNVSCVKVEIRDEFTPEQDSSQFKDIEGTTSAFTERQKPDSGTDDSESDSSDSVVSENKSSGSETSSESESEVVRTPVKRRNGNANSAKQTCDKPKKKTGLYKGELDIEDLPPIEDLCITVPKEECEPLGTICSIVNQLVVVQSMENKPALNLDSLLFKDDGGCIGQIFDVFGPVKTPFYTVRFNTKEEVIEKGVQVGQTVYCAPQTPHTKYVFVYQLMKQKGSDASWKHNYEVPDTMVDYSDDEEEKRARRKHRQKTRDKPWQAADHESAQKVRPVVPDYNRYTGNDWYKARVADLNQFNHPNSNQRLPNNVQQQRNFPPNSGINSTNGQPPIFFPPSLVRPPTPNNWSSPPPNVPFGPPMNQVPGGFCQPPPPYCPPNPSNSQFYPNQFPPPIPYSAPPPHIPYEKLNMPIQFTNPMMSFSNILPHQPSSSVQQQWQQNIPPPQVPLRLDNQQKKLTTPRSANPAMSNIPRMVSNCVPSPPPPPSAHNKDNPHANYYNQPPPKF